MSKIDDDFKISNLEISNNLGLTLSGENSRIKHIGEGSLSISSNNGLNISSNNGFNISSNTGLINITSNSNDDESINLLSSNGGINLQADTNINLLGGIVGGYDIIAPTGITTTYFPASLTTLTTLLNSTNTGVSSGGDYLNVDLSNGTNGQIKHFALYLDGGSGNNDARIRFNTTSGSTTINLDNPGKTLSLLSTPSGWLRIGGTA